MGGAANEWENPLSFSNFHFKDGKIAVQYVNIYDQTNNVTFENMDFQGTGWISIMHQAFNIKFIHCKNLPEIRYYGASGRIYPSAQELTQRGISIIP